MNATDPNAEMIGRIRRAPFYQTYEGAFQMATGLPLILVAEGQEDFYPCDHEVNRNRFCKMLLEGDHPCESCIVTHHRIMAESKTTARTTKCFAGLTETVVPVRLGHETLGYLRTGQVLTEPAAAEKFEQFEGMLREGGWTDEEVGELRKAYFASPVIDRERYACKTTLLSAFSLQLSGLMNRILVESRVDEPEIVVKGKEYILGNLQDKVTLEDVAHHVNVSSFYFSKLFRRVTGMTFTEYVNRQRVEWAMRELQHTSRRVTEVAYGVGYQSLSQFNRNFLKFVGLSPTEFRKGLLETRREAPG